MILVDSFLFYNEVDLLEYRLNILNEIVDYFVIIESTHTFIGNPKGSYYSGSTEKFEKFKDKIIHVVVDHFNTTPGNQWGNECTQRNAITKGIQRIPGISPEDVIILTDVDEIPDPRTLLSIKNGEIEVTINSLEQDLYYYNLRTRTSNKWNLSKIIKYSELQNKTPNQIRNLPGGIIPRGGWHLSYFGDSSFIANKVKNFSHQEYNNATILGSIQEKIDSSSDLFNRGGFNRVEIINNEYLPIEYLTYLSKYL